MNVSTTDSLADFYWELFSKLCERGFDKNQAMKIILKEAKMPKSKEKLKVDVEELVKQIEEKL